MSSLKQRIFPDSPKAAEGVGIAEVFELDEDVGPAAAGFGDEFVNELTIFRTAAALLAQTKVQRIVQIFFAVRADVEHDRQRLFRSNAGAGGIERELAAGMPMPLSPWSPDPECVRRP